MTRKKRDDIHILEDVDGSYVIGRWKDHNVQTIYFDFLEGTNNWLILTRNGRKHEFPIPENKWDVTNTYTYDPDMSRHSVKHELIYRAETKEIIDNESIRHDGIFKFKVLESLDDSKSSPIEEIPPAYENEFIKMVEVEQEFRDRLEHSGTGTSNYNFLSNKPKINNHELSGNLSAEDLGLAKDFELGNGFKEEPGSDKRTISVNTALKAEQDNTLPITSAAVFTEIGNIDSLLKTI